MTKIAEAIKPNGNQEISAQVLRDVLLEIAEAGDDTLSVITTSIEPTINGLSESKLDKTTHEHFVEETVARVKTLEDMVDEITIPTKTSELTNDSNYVTSVELESAFNELSENIDAEAAAAQNQAIETAKAYTDDKVPTKVSQLRNDADYATTAQVQTAKNEAYSNAMSYTNAQVQKKGDWVGLTPIVSNGESVKTLTIGANTFTEVKDAVSSLTVSVLAGDPMAGKNVLEASTYALQFTTADTVGDFVFPTGWKFPEDVTIEPNTTYQVTAVNGLALIVGWPNS